MVSVMRGQGRQRGSRLGPVASSFNSPAASISPSCHRKHRRHHTGSLSPSFARLKHRVGVLGSESFGWVATSIQPPPRITGCLWPSLSPSPTAISSSLSIARVRVLGMGRWGREGGRGRWLRSLKPGKKRSPLPFFVFYLPPFCLFGYKWLFHNNINWHIVFLIQPKVQIVMLILYTTLI